MVTATSKKAVYLVCPYILSILENMPFKKLIYILLSAWLINALVCFQGSNVFENGTYHVITHPGQHYVPNTLFGLLHNTARQVEDNEDGGVEKIKNNLRYLARLQPSVSLFWMDERKAGSDNWLSLKRLQTVGCCNKKLSWLPSPDLHIFRLTPF